MYSSVTSPALPGPARLGLPVGWCRVRGLPIAYQAVLGLLLLLTLSGLWLAHLCDPGIIPPAREKGE